MFIKILKPCLFLGAIVLMLAAGTFTPYSSALAACGCNISCDNGTSCSASGPGGNCSCNCSYWTGNASCSGSATVAVLSDARDLLLVEKLDAVLLASKAIVDKNKDKKRLGAFLTAASRALIVNDLKRYESALARIDRFVSSELGSKQDQAFADALRRMAYQG